MIRPQPRSSMPSITCLVTWNRLLRFVSMTWCHCSFVILRNVPSRVIPALLTSTSITCLLGAALLDRLDGRVPVRDIAGGQ